MVEGSSSFLVSRSQVFQLPWRPQLVFFFLSSGSPCVPTEEVSEPSKSFQPRLLKHSSLTRSRASLQQETQSLTNCGRLLYNNKTTATKRQTKKTVKPEIKPLRLPLPVDCSCSDAAFALLEVVVVVVVAAAVVLLLLAVLVVLLLICWSGLCWPVAVCGWRRYYH